MILIILDISITVSRFIVHSIPSSISTLVVIEILRILIPVLVLISVEKDHLLKKSNFSLPTTIGEYIEGDWQTLLNLVSRGELGELYLWVQPTEKELHFLARELTSAGIQSVLSVGCGTGLLEWLLQSVTGLQVKGLEVDRSWWESPYSPPTFIPLHYADEDDVVCSPQTALLFCYFNNRPAFLKYVASFTGQCLVVIGPDEGSGRHTDPQPFDSQLHDMGWTVQSATKIQNTVDYIVIYRPQSLPH